MEGSHWKWHICILVGSALLTAAYGATDPGDLKVLVDFKNGMKNPEVLQWPDNGVDPCGPPSWPYVYCSGNRVTQIQAKNLNLKGHLPQNFNQLSELYNLGLMNNSLSGMLPTFKGLSKLEYAFLNDNQFDAIPSDFFSGLASLRVLGLGGNPLNASSGWSFPHDLANSTQLTDVSLVRCNLIGTLPDFLGTLPSLNALMLSYNRLSGGIPASFKQSALKTLWLNNQDGVGMNGTIDAIASMQFLTKAWLHGNQFSGPIPETIGNLVSLEELNLNKNQLVGMIPRSLANMELRSLVLNNNYLMGPIPKFKAANVSYDFNSFCQTKPGVQCAPEVTVLLNFLGDLNYPLSLVSKWSGNDPCAGPWFGLNCDPQSKVSVINLPGYQLNGTVSPSIAKLGSLLEIRLGGNNIHGRIPSNLTGLQLLRLLDLSGNNIEPPLPKFHDGVKLITEGNPLVANRTENVPPSDTTPSKKSPSEAPPSPFYNRSSSSITSSTYRVQKSSRNFTTVILAGVATFAAVVLVVVSITICCCKKKNVSIKAPGSVVVHPAAPSNPESEITIAVSSDKEEEKSIQTTTTIDNISIGTQNSSVINDGNMVISAQVLREVTNNFAAENELGHGGFGTVYMGELEDGTKVAVKRMEGGAITSKGFDEFQSEIAVLSKVRHKHLVSLLGYSIEGNERLLAYEYMPQGALSKHLFHWKSLNLEPLSWTSRLTIALDVARGIEYLHSLACQTFIHRDLKSSNILLGDNFRAKVSDFGLVKLAPDGGKSVVTKLAGTFGYLAPEYAVMGKITTKVDVFSYGVVLMELLTGRMALDESRPEETRYLAEWFWRIKSSRHKVMAAVDPVVDATDESISIIAELAGHCTAREPLHRPDMGHVVNVLAPLTEKWKPFDEESSFSGIDYSLGLPKMLKMWQDAGSRGISYSSLEDSKESIPARPSGFAESFTSMDGR